MSPVCVLPIVYDDSGMEKGGPNSPQDIGKSSWLRGRILISISIITHTK
jgi:hypothetical protein